MIGQPVRVALPALVLVAVLACGAARGAQAGAAAEPELPKTTSTAKPAIRVADPPENVEREQGYKK